MRANARTHLCPPPRNRVLTLLAAVLSLLVPSVAAAEWGSQNWGEMVWGGSLLANIPSMPIEGMAALAGLLLALSYWLLAGRRKPAKNPSRHS